jgi:hypothetical protein
MSEISPSRRVRSISEGIGVLDGTPVANVKGNEREKYVLYVAGSLRILRPPSPNTEYQPERPNAKARISLSLLGYSATNSGEMLWRRSHLSVLSITRLSNF